MKAGHELVVDSSVALAWVLSDERNDSTDQILGLVSRAGAWVPAIWRVEVANILLHAVKQRRLDPEGRHQAMASLSALDISIDPDTNAFAWSSTVELAERFALTSYDACYLELAQRRSLPLATLDRELYAAGRQLGISLL
jgi:predicted nucleic acid-binding protein